MGEVEVLVGCPHRLRQPITSRTRLPCPACAPFGPPGWPRLAIALTVDYGPRLSVAATDGIVRHPEPPKPVTATDLRKAVTHAMALSNVMAHPTLIESARNIVVEQGALTVMMQPQSEADQRANIVRIAAEQAIRFRSR